MSAERHMVAIPEAKWREIQRIIKLLPFLANTPSAFVFRAVENEIERVWREFKLTPEGRPRLVVDGVSGPREARGTG